MNPQGPEARRAGWGLWITPGPVRGWAQTGLEQPMESEDRSTLTGSRSRSIAQSLIPVIDLVPSVRSSGDESADAGAESDSDGAGGAGEHCLDSGGVGPAPTGGGAGGVPGVRGRPWRLGAGLPGATDGPGARPRTRPRRGGAGGAGAAGGPSGWDGDRGRRSLHRPDPALADPSRSAGPLVGRGEPLAGGGQLPRRAVAGRGGHTFRPRAGPAPGAAAAMRAGAERMDCLLYTSP